MYGQVGRGEGYLVRRPPPARLLWELDPVPHLPRELALPQGHQLQPRAPHDSQPCPPKHPQPGPHITPSPDPQPGPPTSPPARTPRLASPGPEERRPLTCGGKLTGGPGLRGRWPLGAKREMNQGRDFREGHPGSQTAHPWPMERGHYPRAPRPELARGRGTGRGRFRIPSSSAQVVELLLSLSSPSPVPLPGAQDTKTRPR